jgi:autotransporter-associated beta strand protein
LGYDRTGDNDGLTSSEAGIESGYIDGATLGPDFSLPKLSEIHFKWGRWGGNAVPPNFIGLVIDKNASVTFDLAEDFLLVEEGKTAIIEFDKGASLSLSDHERSDADAVGGTISVLGGSEVVFDNPLPNVGPGVPQYAGNLLFNNNRLLGDNASGGAIGASRALGDTWIRAHSLESITLTGNLAQGTQGNGGGFYAQGESGAHIGIIALSAIFSDNKAGNSGGSMYASANGGGGGVSVSVESSSFTFENNHTGTEAGGFLDGGAGGAIYSKSVNSGASVQLVASNDEASSTFHGIPQGDHIGKLISNKASEGGAIFCEGGDGGRVALNSAGQLIISDNEAAKNGGAVFLKTTSGVAELEVYARDGNISGNKAALDAGAGYKTGGAFHVEGAGGVDFYLLCDPAYYPPDQSPPQDLDGTFIVQNNTVSTGATEIRRAVYLNSNATDSSDHAGLIAIGAGTVKLYDGITAFADLHSKGYRAEIAYGTIAQIGKYANVFIFGETQVSYGTHRLEDGARYQTYNENSPTPKGSYELAETGTLAVKGMGENDIRNTIASEKFKFAKNSTLKFELEAGFLPGNDAALLKLVGGNTPDTSQGYVLPGANKVDVSGDVRTGGYYYLLDATALGDHSVAASGTLSTANFTINENPVTPIGENSPETGRSYAVAELLTSTPDAPGTSEDRLYLHVENLYGNTELTWNSAAGNVWKVEATTQTAANWSGQIYTGPSPTSIADVNTFLNGDIVEFGRSDARTIAVDTANGGVIVGQMTVSNGQYTFTGGKIKGSGTDSTYSTYDTRDLPGRTTGNLHVEEGANVTFQNLVEFNDAEISGENTTVNFQRATYINRDFKIANHASATIAAPFNVAENISVGYGDNKTTPFSGSNLVIANGGALGSAHNKNVMFYSPASYVKFDRSAGNNYTYSGVISGNGSLLKTGTGKLTLTQNQAYTGQLAITGGTLLLAGITQEADSGKIDPNATLAGTGQVTGNGWPLGSSNGEFRIDGRISPGTTSGNTPAAIGTLSFAKIGGTVILGATSEYLFDIGTGSRSDLLLLEHGDIIIDDGAQLILTGIVGIPGTQIQAHEEFVLLATLGGTITNTSGGDLAGDFANGTIVLDGNPFEILTRDRAGGGRELVLISTRAIPILPEPSTYALTGGLVTLLLAHLRRRKKHPKK